jgi:hypothetical protein
MTGYQVKSPKMTQHEQVLSEHGYFLRLEFETVPGRRYLKERCILCKDDGEMNMAHGSEPIVGEWNEPLSKLLRRIGWIKPKAIKRATTEQVEVVM